MGKEECAIPGEIQEIFEKLKRNIVWLHARWIVFHQLFCHSEKRVQLLNECASACFFLTENALLDEIQLGVCKLIEPGQFRGRQRLCLEQLINRTRKIGNEKLASALKQDLKELRKRCRALMERRNRRLAHLDLRTALEAKVKPLPAISRQMLDDGLALLRRFMNRVDIHYRHPQFMYDFLHMRHGDGDALATWLQYGIRYQELVRDGTIPPGDWREGAYSDA